MQRATDLAAVVRDPARFARGILQSDVWPLQEAILRSVAANPRTAVKACHASGKTFCAALALLWWVTRHQDAIVVTTAPTWTQVEKLLWGEVHRAIARSRIAYPKPITTELKLGPGRYAIGLSTNEGVRFQGFHGDHVLVILDEAPGVKPEIWEAIEGARAGGDVRLLALGNPTITSGPFYDAFAKDRVNWTTFTISAFDTPNLAGLDLPGLLALDDAGLAVSPRPYLVTRAWVREKYVEWGSAHPLWQARVLGQFPAQADDALVALAWIERARAQEVADDGSAITAGIDVAGPGEDETVLCIRQGPRVLREQWWPSPDPRGELLAALAPYRDRHDAVQVDSAGIGYYLAKHLKDAGFRVVGVNVGEAASDPDRYANLKAEHYWGLRMRFEAGDIGGALSERTVSQLAGIRWSTNARGQIVIESKVEARKRGVKSPDRAEALMLAFAKARTSGFLDFIRDEQRRAAEAAQEGMT